LTPDIFKLASARRRYNRERRTAASARRAQIARLLDEYGSKRRGARARIARELGVSRATVTRDVAQLNFERWFNSLPAAEKIALLNRHGLL
jgi:DNA invertase Pin-like site-specific DNA recombinase